MRHSIDFQFDGSATEYLKNSMKTKRAYTKRWLMMKSATSYLGWSVGAMRSQRRVRHMSELK